MIRLKDVEMEYENGTKAIRGISLTIEDGSSCSWWDRPDRESPPSSSC